MRVNANNMSRDTFSTSYIQYILRNRLYLSGTLSLQSKQYDFSASDSESENKTQEC